MAPSGFHTWSQTAASNNTADSSINWAEGQAPSSVNDSARGMMSVQAKWRDDNNGSLATGGTSTAYTLTTNTGFTTLALMDNQTLAFTMNATSGATPTLNVDGLGAKVIRNATGVALPTGALLSGAVYHATYDNGTGEWLLHNQPGVVPAGSVATASLADDAVTYAKMQNVSATSRLLGRATAGAGDVEELTIGTNLQLSGNTLSALGQSAAQVASLLFGYLSGLTLSTAGSSTSFSVAVGTADDSTGSDIMVSGTPITKTTASWVVGTGNGGLDTGAIAASTWYHVYLIKRPDTGVVDVLFSLSASAPTMPTNYTRSRRIGSIKTNGSSQWTLFRQNGDEFLWDTAVQDINTSSLGTSAVTFALGSVPTGVVVNAIGNISALGGAANSLILVSSLDESDQTPSTTAAPGHTLLAYGSSSEYKPVGRFSIRTDTSAQIRARGTAANATLKFNTIGWIDTRGK